MKLIFILCHLSFIFIASAYMQFDLIRNPHPSKKIQLLKSECQDPATISQQSKYIELCYQKDIAYVFQFNHAKKISYLALDLTSPISWIKDDKCKMLGNNKACSSISSNYGQKIKGMMKQKINQLINKIIDKREDDSSKAIIEGSNQIITGDVVQVKDLSIVGRNHGHLDKLIDIILLGLYIIGEHDTIKLNTTNFISANRITPNLNNICDGAVSLRFDQTSEKSFLNQVFDYLKTNDSIISVYLSKDKSVVTIGGMSPKYAQKGISSINRVKMEQDEKYGKLPRLQAIIFQTQDDAHNIDVDSLIIFTLSASYIGFSQHTIDLLLGQVFPSTLKCKINNQSYIQCLNNNKQDVKILLETSLNLDLDTSMIHFQMKELVIKNEGGKLIFNIKQTPNNHTVVGQPFFLKYYVIFDYCKNEIGYSLRKLTIQQSLISAITLIHFIMVTVLLGLCFILTSDPCKKLYYHIFTKIAERTQESIKNTFKSYQPVDDELQDKNKSELPKLQQDVQGI